MGQKGGGSLFSSTALPPNWTRFRVQECLRLSCLHLTSSFTSQKEYDLVYCRHYINNTTTNERVCGPPSRPRISARAYFTVYHLLLGIRSNDFLDHKRRGKYFNFRWPLNLRIFISPEAWSIFFHWLLFKSLPINGFVNVYKLKLAVTCYVVL